MNQHFVKFSLPKGKHIHVNDFREAVAKELDGCDFEGKPEIFNYQNNSQTKMKRPSSRFLGGSGWLSFLTESDPTLVARVIAPAITYLTKSGIQVSTYIGEQEKSARLTNEPKLYRVTKLADQRDKAREAKGFVRTPKENVEYMIQQMLDEAFNSGVISQPIDREDALLNVLEADKKGESIGFKGKTRKSIAKISATFSLNVKLEGAWQAGHLQSRGYGIIYPINHGGFTQCPV